MKAALALLSGLLLAASFPKFGHPAFAWIAIAPLIVAAVLTANGPSLARPLRLGILTGIVYFGGSLYWVVQVMTTYGGLATPVAALVGILLVVYLALYPGLFALLLAASVRRWGIGGVWLAPLHLGRRRMGPLLVSQRVPVGDARHVAGDASSRSSRRRASSASTVFRRSSRSSAPRPPPWH